MKTCFQATALVGLVMLAGCSTQERLDTESAQPYTANRPIEAPADRPANVDVNAGPVHVDVEHSPAGPPMDTQRTSPATGGSTSVDVNTTPALPSETPASTPEASAPEASSTDTTIDNNSSTNPDKDASSQP